MPFVAIVCTLVVASAPARDPVDGEAPGARPRVDALVVDATPDPADDDELPPPALVAVERAPDATAVDRFALLVAIALGLSPFSLVASAVIVPACGYATAALMFLATLVVATGRAPRLGVEHLGLTVVVLLVLHLTASTGLAMALMSPLLAARLPPPRPLAVVVGTSSLLTLGGAALGAGLAACASAAAIAVFDGPGALTSAGSRRHLGKVATSGALFGGLAGVVVGGLSAAAAHHAGAVDVE